MQNTITTTDSAINIRKLEVTDPDSVRYFGGLDEPQRVPDMLMAIRLGTMMLERANVSSQSDFLQTKMLEVVHGVEAKAGEVVATVEKSIRKRLDPAEADSVVNSIKKLVADDMAPVAALTKSIQQEYKQLDQALNPANSDGYTGRMLKQFGEVERQFSMMFDPSNKHSFPAWIDGKLGDVLGKRLEAQLEQIRNSTKEELQRVQVELAKMQTAKETVEELEKKTPLKGGSFEESILHRLETLAKATSSIVNDVTSSIGDASASKKGDFTIDLGGCEEKRIVVECKDSTMASCPKVLTDMAKTIGNRRAQFGIYLVKEEDQLQKQVGSWQIYRDQKVLITHASMLEPSLRIAQMMVELESQAVDGVDVATIEGQLTVIANEAAKSRQAKMKLTNIEGAVDALRQLEDERSKKIVEAIGLIRDELAQASLAAA